MARLRVLLRARRIRRARDARLAREHEEDRAQWERWIDHEVAPRYWRALAAGEAPMLRTIRESLGDRL